MPFVYDKEFETYEKAWNFAVTLTNEGRGIVEEFLMRSGKYVITVRV
jgi:hypothetical protein